MATLPPPRETVERLESGRIDAACFDHEAHVYAAWCYLSHYPAEQASERFIKALRRLTVRMGVPGKYHDTITRFYLLLIEERLRLTPAADWDTFRRANPDLLSKSKNVLYRYYSRERLATERARTSFVLPDRIAA